MESPRPTFNFLMKRKTPRFFADDIKRCTCVALLACGWMGIAPELYRQIPAKATEWMNEIYHLFDGNLLLNVPVCLILIYQCVKCLKRLVSYKHIRYNWFFIIAYVYLVLYYKSPFIYATIALGIDYRLFLSVLLGIVFVSMVVKVKVLLEQKKPTLWTDLRLKERSIRLQNYLDEGENLPTFSPDYNANIQLPKPVKIYAETIVDKILSTIEQ